VIANWERMEEEGGGRTVGKAGGDGGRPFALSYTRTGSFLNPFRRSTQSAQGFPQTDYRAITGGRGLALILVAPIGSPRGLKLSLPLNPAQPRPLPLNPHKGDTR
jgi:hypothetical protein